MAPAPPHAAPHHGTSPRRHRCSALLLGLFLLSLVPAASAHGMGGSGVEARFVLPAWAVWVTGAAVVAVSFVVVAGFLTRSGQGVVPEAQQAAGRRPPRPFVRGVFRGLAVAMLLLLAANAFVPGGGSLFPPVVVWIVLWGAFPLFAYVWGNPWEWLSPFQALAPLARRLSGGRSPLAYPARLGAWPSVVTLVALVGYEVWSGPGSGATGLARAALAYTLVTLAGMTLFGEEAWLSNAEGLTRFFRTWSAFSSRSPGGGWRAPGAGLAGLRAATSADVAFVVALLYGVNFDGFLATGAGRALMDILRPPLGSLGAHLTVLATGYVVFLAAFWTCAAFIRRASESLEPLRGIAARFAVALVPIAVGYHVAHNLFLLLESAPVVASAFLDPLGARGLEASAFMLPLAWGPWIAGLQMFAIVAGHVIAVVVAHHLAVGGFPSRLQALRSEVPLTAIMSFYTLVGLWIVSQGAHGAVTGVGA